MDEELTSSTAPTGTPPAAPNLHDWNTALAAPAPDASSGFNAAGSDASGPAAVSLNGTTDAATTGGTPSTTPRRGLNGGRPEWRDPADLPEVQRTHTGVFGDKLQALDDAARTVRAVMDSLDLNALSDSEVVALTQMVERTGRPVDAARVSTATVVGHRSRSALGRESMAWRLGATHTNDLLIRLTGTSVPEMKRRVALGEKVASRAWGGAVLDGVPVRGRGDGCW